MIFLCFEKIELFIYHNSYFSSQCLVAKNPVIIGGLSKEESMKYLIKKRNIKEVDAKKIFDLVGDPYRRVSWTKIHR